MLQEPRKIEEQQQHLPGFTPAEAEAGFPLKMLWVLFFLQPFWGYYLPTSIPFWALVTGTGFLILSLNGFRLTTYEVLILMLPFASVAGWVWSGNFDVGDAWYQARWTLQEFIFAVAILATLRSRARISSFLSLGVWFSYGTLLMSLVSLVSGTYFRSFHFEEFSGFERAGGWIGIPNAFSPFPVLASIFCYYRYLQGERKGLWLCLMGIFGIMIITTLSRNAMAAIGAFYLVSYFTLFYTGTGLKKHGKTILYGLALGIIALGLYRYEGQAIIDVLTRDVALGPGRTIENGRLDWWVAHFLAMSVWSVDNFVFGITYSQLGLNLQTGLGQVLTAEEWAVTSAVENGFLYVFLGSGLIGIALLLGSIAVSLRDATRLQKSVAYQDKLLGALAVGSIVALFFQAMFTDFMYLTATTYYYVLLGLPVIWLRWAHTDVSTGDIH